MRIERIEPKTIFGYTWGIHGLPDSDPRRTYVEFTMTPDDEGTTVTVVESGFSQLDGADHSKAFGGNTEGWASELDELVVPHLEREIAALEQDDGFAGAGSLVVESRPVHCRGSGVYRNGGCSRLALRAARDEARRRDRGGGDDRA
jgi:hypothetical protein